MKCAGRRRPPIQVLFRKLKCFQVPLVSVPQIYLRVRADVQLFANGRPDYPQAYVRWFTNSSLINHDLIGTILQTGGMSDPRRRCEIQHGEIDRQDGKHTCQRAMASKFFLFMKKAKG